MTYDDLRAQYQSDAALARALFDECARLRAEVTAAESMLALREALWRRRASQDQRLIQG